MPKSALQGPTPATPPEALTTTADEMRNCPKCARMAGWQESWSMEPEAKGEVDVGIHREQVLTNPAITRTRILRSPVGLCQFGLRGFSSCQWRGRQAHAQARLLNHPTGREPALNRAADTTTTPNVDLWIIITPNGREPEATVNSLELHRTTLPTNRLNSHFLVVEHFHPNPNF